MCRGTDSLSTVGFLEQIVTFVGAGEGRSGVGTLASPMGGRGETAGEPDAGRPKGPHPSSLPPPPLRDEPASLLVSQNTYPREGPENGVNVLADITCDASSRCWI